MMLRIASCLVVWLSLLAAAYGDLPAPPTNPSGEALVADTLAKAQTAEADLLALQVIAANTPTAENKAAVTKQTAVLADANANLSKARTICVKGWILDARSKMAPLSTADAAAYVKRIYADTSPTWGYTSGPFEAAVLVMIKCKPTAEDTVLMRDVINAGLKHESLGTNIASFLKMYSLLPGTPDWESIMFDETMAPALRDLAISKFSDANPVATMADVKAMIPRLPPSYLNSYEAKLAANSQFIPPADDKTEFYILLKTSGVPYLSRLNAKIRFATARSLGADEIKAAVTEYVSTSTDDADSKAGAVISTAKKVGTALTNDDVTNSLVQIQSQDSRLLVSIVNYYTSFSEPLRMVTRTPQDFVEGVKLELRFKNGRVAKTDIQPIIDKLINGQGDWTTTTQDKTIAFGTALEAAQGGPNYVSSMYKGQFGPAVVYAFNNTKSAPSDANYMFWVEQVRRAVICYDMQYNGRAVDIVKWFNGTLPDNPIADILSGQPTKVKPKPAPKTR